MSGLTPLHLAVRSADETKSARSVKLLLIKGAGRNIRDALNRKPIDIANECKQDIIKKEL
jgi:ankyrin repeat protein